MDGAEVGRINLGLTTDPRLFSKQLSGIAKSAEKSVTSVFKPIGKMIGSVLAVGAITKFTKSCLDLGSDLSEVQNVVDTTFRTMNESVNSFALTSMQQFGLSETITKKYMGTLGAMSKSMGFSEVATYDMAKAVTGLAGDVASFYNMSSDEAFTKLKSIWTGETETLKEIGVLLTQTNLDQYALNNGFGKTTAKMTEQEKVMLRYQYTMSALADASGDFAKTSGSWANQTRILSLQFDALKATLGQGFINLFTPIIQMINKLLAKLQTLAGYFKQFTEYLTGASQAGSAASGIATDTETAAGNIANMAAGAKETAKSLSGIDKLNMVADTASAGGAGESASLGLNNLPGLGMSEQVQATEKELDNLISQVGELKELLKTGFTIGLGDFKTPVEQIKGHLCGIKEAIQDIAKDSGVQSAADNLLKSFMLNTGKIAGSWTSVGLTIGRNLLGGLDKYLTENKGYISSRLVGIMNELSGILASAGDFSVVFADIFSVFGGENGTDLTSQLMELIVNPFLAARELLVSIVNDGLAMITQPIMENKEQIKLALDGLLGTLATLAGALATHATTMGEAVLGVYDTYISPAFENIKTGISQVLEVGLDLWNTYVSPFLQDTANRLSSLMSEYVTPFVAKLVKFGGQIVEIVSLIWKNWLVPFWAWIQQSLVPVFTKLASHIVENFHFIGEQIGVVVNMAMDILNGLAEFIAGALSGDMLRAGNGIKDIFRGVINGIIEFFENGINFIIGRLNKLSITVPDWVPEIGGESFGFSLSQVSIPRLAQGGYVGANQPRLVMIGDNRHEGEIVSPESKLFDMAKMAAEEGMSGKELMEIIMLLKEILYLLKEMSAKELMAVIRSSDVYRAWKQEKAAEEKRIG